MRRANPPRTSGAAQQMIVTNFCEIFADTGEISPDEPKVESASIQQMCLEAGCRTARLPCGGPPALRWRSKSSSFDPLVTFAMRGDCVGSE